MTAVIDNKKPIKLKIYLLAVNADAKQDELLDNAVYIQELKKMNRIDLIKKIADIIDAHIEIDYEAKHSTAAARDIVNLLEEEKEIEK